MRHYLRVLRRPGFRRLWAGSAVPAAVLIAARPGRPAPGQATAASGPAAVPAGDP